jgi:hypothetical protein
MGREPRIGGFMRESDATYFRRRAGEERAAAAKASSDEARYAHLEMAQRYAELARAIEHDEARHVLKIAN